MVLKKSQRSITSNTAVGDGKNVYNSNRKHSDRNFTNSELAPFDIKVTKTSSVILLLDSEEVEVVQKSLHHLDKFASHQLLESHGKTLYDAILKLYIHEDLIVKRFIFKLLVQLTSTSKDFKKRLLKDDALIKEMKKIFTSSSDDVLVEFASVLLQRVCDDPKQIDSLGRDEMFLQSLFNKFKSHDPDILLQSMQLLNVMMRNSILIETVVTRKDFPFKNVEIELRNENGVIQMAALESLLTITNFDENPFWDILGSYRFIESVYGISMKIDEEFAKTSLKVFKNLCKNREILLKLSKSDYFFKLVSRFMDKSSQHRELLLTILMELAKIDDNRNVLCENGIIKEILEMLRDNGPPEACEAIIVLSTNIFCLKEILAENVYTMLLNIAMNDEREWSQRTVALQAFLKLINIQGFEKLMEISQDIGDGIANILMTSDNINFNQLAINILMKLSEYREIKGVLCETKLSEAIFHALARSSRSTQLMVRLFNLISNFIDQENVRKEFFNFNAIDLMKACMTSPASQIKAGVCNFINASTNYQEFVEIFIQQGILKILKENFDCTICSDAFETILEHDLSIKFAFRGRLEAKDKIKSGFYASKGKRIQPEKLRETIFSESSSPRSVVYTINIDGELKLGERSILFDKSFVELINDVQTSSTFKTAELHEKIKFIATQVSKFLQTTDECTSHQLHLHLTELKFKFSSSVIPLGSLICGNSFEAAILFKAIADLTEIDASLNVNDTGKAWNQVCNDTNVVDLMFDVGEMYEASSYVARKYLLEIS